MEPTVGYRRLGASGLKITEITYGNWLTHGSQVEADTAIECVHTALDLGITSFDTADVYANTAAEEVLGPVGAASPWRSSPRSTGPSAPRAPMTWVCHASTSWRASTVPSRA